MSAANGVTKTQVYYPRPRSYSAGSQTVMVASNKRLSAPVTSTAPPAMKIVRINASSKMYGKTKSIEEKKALASPTASSAMRYKTELCRPFQENGFCKYGDKCQFAHGEQDLRSLPRHPKYKTELCRTYHTRGFCPYGVRCHFIHNIDETRKNQENGIPKSPTKRTFSFSMPISPSLDSGISSPDDYQRGRFFEFPGTDHSSGSGSDGDLGEFEHSLDQEGGYVPPQYNGQESMISPDPFMDLDLLSVGSESPVKPTSDEFTEVCSIKDLLSHMSLEDPPSQGIPPIRISSCHHLPVFDDMLNTKSDSALLEESLEHATNPFRFCNAA